MRRYQSYTIALQPLYYGLAIEPRTLSVLLFLGSNHAVVATTRAVSLTREEMLQQLADVAWSTTHFYWLTDAHNYEVTVNPLYSINVHSAALHGLLITYGQNLWPRIRVDPLPLSELDSFLYTNGELAHVTTMVTLRYDESKMVVPISGLKYKVPPPAYVGNAVLTRTKIAEIRQYQSKIM